MLAKAATPQVTYTVDGDNWTIVTTGLKDTTVKFKLGAEQDDETPDGRKVKSVYTLESPTKLVQKERWDGKEATLVREVSGDALKVVWNHFLISSLDDKTDIDYFSILEIDHHLGQRPLHSQLQTPINVVVLFFGILASLTDVSKQNDKRGRDEILKEIYHICIWLNTLNKRSVG